VVRSTEDRSLGQQDGGRELRGAEIILTRRGFIEQAALAAASGLSRPPLATADDGARDAASPCDLVDPFIGTGGHGHTYPGATMPFGMVQLSPDTNVVGWEACSGYHHDDDSIMGFSHTHLSGTGAGDMLDLLVMPATGPVLLSPGAARHPPNGYRSRFDPPAPANAASRGDPPSTGGGQQTKDGYRSRFDHADERASPGYYKVVLKDYGVTAELTATPRVGMHRYRFARREPAHLVIDLAHGIGEHPRVTDAFLRWLDDDLLVGARRVGEWASGRQIFFALQVSQSPRTVRLYSHDQPLLVDARHGRGTQLKCVVAYGDPGPEPLLLKVGLSGVDIDGALRNLRTEAPGWDFDEIQGAARRAWDAELSRVRVEGGDEDDRRIFYTALYHTMLAPTLFSDVDGRYRGMDGAVHQLAPGVANYSTYSLWDTYRAQHPLLTLLQSERAADLASGLVRMSLESPAGPPVWPLQAIETSCMIGWHSAAVLAEAHVKKLPGVDVAHAWSVFRKRAFDDDALGLARYRRDGFIPSDEEPEAVSKTLDYAYDDWAMAHIADAAGAADDAATLRHRSSAWRNLFDPATGFVRPRLASGDWAEPFDPAEMGHSRRWRDCTESNPWQATFGAQHDVHGLIALFDGATAFEAKLDELFTTASTLPADYDPDIAGLVGQYAHGNEPSHHVAYLYAYAGAHHKTQARVRMLLRTMYRTDPDGLAGNEDCGQMSAWYVMSALGLYAVDPVSGLYIFGSPLFDRAELRLLEGRTLVVEARNNGPERPYVQAIQWNDQPYSRCWISHAELAQGGKLAFQMSAAPNLDFAAAAADRPPSFL
jgi:predicted alpha-1,2-mannosidase